MKIFQASHIYLKKKKRKSFVQELLCVNIVNIPARDVIQDFVMHVTQTQEIHVLNVEKQISKKNLLNKK